MEGYRLPELLALADEESRSLWDTLSLGYAESQGHPLLRREIAALYTQTSADEVVCCVSAEEAIYLVTRVLVRPGDHVIATFPAYQSSYEVARSIGADVSFLHLHPQKTEEGLSWRLDMDELRRMVRPETRLIAVNFPNNPTGALLSQAEWSQVVSVAREVGCYLLSDEVYRGMEYSETDRLPAAVDAYEKAISIGAMSKTYALAGLRVGWLATKDEALRASVLSYKDYTTICGSAPSEILAIMGLRAKDRVVARTREIIRANLEQVTHFMHEHEAWFEWIAPKAASVAFPRLRLAEPIDSFAKQLVEREGVMILPANVFSYPGNHFRVGLGRAKLNEALERIGRFVRAY